MKKLVLLLSLILSGCLFLLTIPTSAQNCPNLNLIRGNFDNWGFYLGTCGSGANINPSGETPGRHTIMDAAQLLKANMLPDEQCLTINKVPTGFSYSARIGNSSTGAEMEAIEYTMRVDSTNSLLILHFAWVMEDPSHTPGEQPRFTLTIKDSAGNPIPNAALPCAFHDFIASGTMTDLACYGSVLARDWTTVGYSLEPMMGRTIKIYFETRDCTLSGHYGYAYVVAECRKMTIDLMYCDGQSSAKFKAPDGFKKYTWTRSIGKPTLIQSGEGRDYQNLTLTNPYADEIITCEVESALKPECSATLRTVIRKTSIEAKFNYGVMEDGEVDFIGHNWQNWYDTCNRTATFVDRTRVVNSTQASRAWLIHGLNMAIPRDSMVTITFPDPGLKGLDSVRYLVRLQVGAENGCADTSKSLATHYITIYASPRVEITGPTEMCQGNTEVLTASTRRSQFASYEWTWYDKDGKKQNGYDSTLTITDPATYIVEAVDVNGCIVRDTHVVSHLIPKMDIDSDPPSCFGGNDGRFTHGSITGASPGAFQTFIWMVTDPAMWPYLDNKWKFDTLNNRYTVLTNTSGSSYSNLVAGTYIFEAVDALGCVLRDEVVIENPPLLELFSSQEETTCGFANGAIILKAKGGVPPYTYSIVKDGGTDTLKQKPSAANMDSVKFTGLEEGLYNIYVTDVGRLNSDGVACTTQDTISVAFFLKPSIELTITDETCESKNGSIALKMTNARPPVTLLWDKDTSYNTTYSHLAKGYHTLRLIDDFGCIVDTAVEVGFHPTPIDTIAVTPETCGREDGTITLTVTSALPNTLKYIWEGRTETTPTLTGLPAGTYNVTIKDSFCVVERTITVPHVDGPIADFQTTTYSVPSNSNFVLTDISKGTVNTWNWDMGDGNTQTGKVVYYSYGIANDYVVFLQVIDENECTDTISKVMHVYDEITVFIPNMFTPNGDELNEVWKPEMTEYVEEGYQLSIFDRWGQRIFHTTNPNEGWNGTSIDGKLVAHNTVYSYRLLVRDFAGQEYEFVGQVTIIR